MKGAAMNDLKTDIANLRKDISRFARYLTPDRRSSLEKCRDRMLDTTSDIKRGVSDSANAVYDNVRDYGGRALRTGAETVKNNPITSAVWGAAIGLLIYKLFERK
jgi:ElaB/YqjD/DUF883 family membrane-anchored ribosome-binding protein